MIILGLLVVAATPSAADGPVERAQTAVETCDDVGPRAVGGSDGYGRMLHTNAMIEGDPHWTEPQKWRSGNSEYWIFLTPPMAWAGRPIPEVKEGYNEVGFDPGLLFACHTAVMRILLGDG